jgi:hypothetical protein
MRGKRVQAILGVVAVPVGPEENAWAASTGATGTVREVGLAAAAATRNSHHRPRRRAKPRNELPPQHSLTLVLIGGAYRGPGVWELVTIGLPDAAPSTPLRLFLRPDDNPSG